ncbi:Tetratricopeptide repeat-containing protein [Daejeonella rubra]|uniref:Tetratricopeptide repeat-containing protein n=1 Tax=Daejeonella rubra TaxID=990371 RepID=A0A1G9R0P8_9SPHI|nr:tetratricopeptide repeat protein [Daejeonella rubra]SDM16700.1 Tetratricopeptide repeat-containing protein [Daejeonella rubra]
MLNRKQIIVVGSVAVLMGLMLSLDIQGLVKPGEGEGATAKAAAPAASTVKAISLDEVSLTAKEGLTASLKSQISDLEAQLKSASEGDKLDLYKKLAQQWDDVNLSTPSSLYYEMIAEKTPDFNSWLKAGDKFTDAYQQSMDTLIQPALVQKAISSYQKADKIKPNTLEVKTGLGIAYVTGTPNPMQGITLLLDVVKQDPKNLKANLNLGLFSMKSGQFDKAVERFKTVIAIAPSAEAWFYLASSYESMDKNADAIAAYLKTKEIAADPNMSQFVDRKINELSN